MGFPVLDKDDTIHGFAELITTLRDGICKFGPKFVKDALERLSIDLSEVTPYVAPRSKIYGRTCIVEESDFSIFVMIWTPGQLTPIHDHRGSACAVRVVSGVASELVFESAPCGTLVPHALNRALPGSVVYSFDADIHQVGNLEAAGDLVTIHCYSPPLTQMRWYEIGATCFADYEVTLSQVLAR